MWPQTGCCISTLSFLPTRMFFIVAICIVYGEMLFGPHHNFRYEAIKFRYDLHVLTKFKCRKDQKNVLWVVARSPCFSSMRLLMCSDWCWRVMRLQGNSGLLLGCCLVTSPSLKYPVLEMPLGFLPKFFWFFLYLFIYVFFDFVAEMGFHSYLPFLCNY